MNVTFPFRTLAGAGAICLVSVGCAEPLKLAEALRLAHNRNPDLLRQQADVAATQGDLVTAGLLPNPQLQLIGDAFDLHSSSPWQPGKKYFGASLQWPVDLAGKRARRVEAAEGILQAAKSGYAEATLQTLLAAGNAWLDAAQAQLSLHTALRAKSIFDSIVVINEIRLRNRVIAPLELMRSRMQADQYENTGREAKLQADRAAQSLGLLLDVDAPFLVAEDDTATVDPPDVDSCLRLALEHRGEWKQAETNVAVSEANVKLQKSLAWPDLNLSLDYSEQQGVPFYGLSLGVPLPVWSRNQGEEIKARAVLRQAELSRGFLRRRLEAEVRQLHREFTERREGLNRLKGVLDSAEKVRTLMEFAYRKGGAPIFDLLDAERTWFDTQQSYYDAWANLKRTGLALAAACGNLEEEYTLAAATPVNKG